MRLLQGESFDVQSKPVVPVDPYSLELGYGLTLLPPLDPPEVWCAGVTYERSLDARMEDSASRDVYADVYRSPRPELFLKDAGARRTVGPGEPIGIRGDSVWNVPEPEIGLVLGRAGKILGFTIECGRDFQPPWAEAEDVIREVCAGLIALCVAARAQSAAGPTA